MAGPEAERFAAGCGGGPGCEPGDGASVQLGPREFEVVIVVHPLSGQRDATAFHLEAGRLCVLTSRHRQACIVVARAGITHLLDAHPATDPVRLNVPVKFPDGWEAHHTVLCATGIRQKRAAGLITGR